MTIKANLLRNCWLPGMFRMSARKSTELITHCVSSVPPDPVQQTNESRIVLKTDESSAAMVECLHRIIELLNGKVGRKMFQ